MKNLTIVLTAAILLGACSSPDEASKANFKDVLNNYFEKNPVCLHNSYQFPSQRYFNSDKKRGAFYESWVERGFLEREKQEGKADLWTLTKDGEKHFINEKFCAKAGNRAVVSVDNFTEPSDAMGVMMSQVNYTYEVTNIPQWTADTAAQDYFGDKIPKSGVEIRDQAVLIKTANGWVHEREMQF